MSYNVGQIMSKKDEAVTFKMTEDELKRLDELVARKKRKYGSSDRTKVIRQLMGLDSPLYITEEDRKFIGPKEETEASQNGTQTEMAKSARREGLVERSKSF